MKYFVLIFKIHIHVVVVLLCQEFYLIRSELTDFYFTHLKGHTPFQE